MKAHEFIVVALILGALISVLDMGGLIVFAMFVALATVCWLVHYFTTDRCPACQLPGALESTGEWRREPSSGFWEREKRKASAMQAVRSLRVARRASPDRRLVIESLL